MISICHNHPLFASAGQDNLYAIEVLTPWIWVQPTWLFCVSAGTAQRYLQQPQIQCPSSAGQSASRSLLLSMPHPVGCRGTLLLAQPLYKVLASSIDPGVQPLWLTCSLSLPASCALQQWAGRSPSTQQPRVKGRHLSWQTPLLLLLIPTGWPPPLGPCIRQQHVLLGVLHTRSSSMWQGLLVPVLSRLLLQISTLKRSSVQQRVLQVVLLSTCAGRSTERSGGHSSLRAEPLTV